MMFKDIFSIRGRIRRTEFILSCLIYAAALFGSVLLAALTNLIFFYIIVVITWFTGTVFRVTQGVKRCHDVGNSGWFQFIPFYFFVMILADGDRRDNRYGPNPKYKEGHNSINQIGREK